MFGAIEAGGTKFVVGVGDAEGGSIRTTRIPTTTPDETLARATDFLNEAAGGAPLAAIGIASFGPLGLDPAAPDYGRLLATPKPGWAGADLRGRIAALTGAPVGIETDVNAAARAEAHAAGCADLAYVTVGTGVGVGLVVDGRAVHGAGHPELGHILPRRHPAHEGFAGVCPFHGDCLEGLASGPAIAAAWGEPLDRLAPDHPARDALTDYLAQLCMILLMATAPRRIVLGGGVMTGGVLLPGIRRRTAALVASYLSGVDAESLESRIAAPLCREPSGLIGAYLVARDAA